MIGIQDFQEDNPAAPVGDFQFYPVRINSGKRGVGFADDLVESGCNAFFNIAVVGIYEHISQINDQKHLRHAAYSSLCGRRQRKQQSGTIPGPVQSPQTYGFYESNFHSPGLCCAVVPELKPVPFRIEDLIIIAYKVFVVMTGIGFFQAEALFFTGIFICCVKTIGCGDVCQKLSREFCIGPEILQRERRKRNAGGDSFDGPGIFFRFRIFLCGATVPGKVIAGVCGVFNRDIRPGIRLFFRIDILLRINPYSGMILFFCFRGFCRKQKPLRSRLSRCRHYAREEKTCAIQQDRETHAIQQDGQEGRCMQLVSYCPHPIKGTESTARKANSGAPGCTISAVSPGFARAAHHPARFFDEKNKASHGREKHLESGWD